MKLKTDTGLKKMITFIKNWPPFRTKVGLSEVSSSLKGPFSCNLLPARPSAVFKTTSRGTIVLVFGR